MTPAVAGRTLRNRLAGMGRRRKLVAAILLGFLAVGGWKLWDWWASWPARLVILDPSQPRWDEPADRRTFPEDSSPDGRTLVASGPKGLVSLDTQSGHPRAIWPVTPGRWVFHGEFSPDGRTFLALWIHRGSPTATIQVDLIDTKTGRGLASVPTPWGGHLGLAFLPDGKTAREATTDGKVVDLVDFDLETGRVRAERRLSTSLPPSLGSMSRDGRLVASVDGFLGLRTPGPGPEVVLWDVESDHEIARFDPGRADVAITALKVSPDASRLAIGRADASLELWDVASRSRVSLIRGHSSGFSPMNLGFSPDGTRLASMGRFNGLAISGDRLRMEIARFTGGWGYQNPVELIVVDVPSGKRVGKTRDEGRPVFLRDGRGLATIDRSGSIRIRDLPAPR